MRHILYYKTDPDWVQQRPHAPVVQQQRSNKKAHENEEETSEVTRHSTATSCRQRKLDCRSSQGVGKRDNGIGC
ncbi:hypothetical protein [Pontibacter pamirensis]|uniref:hypothetical protein n=1 Tax=Pontibacter pamirensis TaxID=2562824 RepID=UPI001F2E1006|nr:hypothetical protein [Pontibacter pamirensis]